MKRSLAFTALLALAACNDAVDDSSTDRQRAPSSTTPSPTPKPQKPVETPINNGPLALSGVAPTVAFQDVVYSFTPSRTGGIQGKIVFSIINKPAWANFSTTTGALSGTPVEAGTSGAIVISVADGATQASLTGFTISVSADPLRVQAWHLFNVGQMAWSQSGGLAGADLNLAESTRQGVLGQNIRVALSDSGTEIAHEDLAANVLPGESRDYRNGAAAPYFGNPTPSTAKTGGDHGTSVAGLIAAVGWNGLGSRGVAPLAKFATFNYLSDDVTDSTALAVDQANGDFDVFNQSWGIDADGDGILPQSYLDQLIYGVTRQPARAERYRLGSLYVKSAGNSFQPAPSSAPWMTADANSDYYNTTPYVVVAGALNAKGTHASYSSIGSSLWVSGFGGEYGKASPAMVTTDRSGCARGYSLSGATTNVFEGGNADNAACNYTSTFNGTSSAAPTVSGAIALILSANPALGWRDVKHILAATATRVDASFAPVVNRSADPVGHVWDQGWVTNAAGYRFHNYYGFGKVDVDAAVAMAKSYVSPAWGKGDFTKLFIQRTGLSLSIPDNNAGGAISSNFFGAGTTIESVEVELSVTHSYTGDLGVELISPSGTRSVMLHVNNAYSSDENFVKLKLLSHAFYGENAYGNWTLRVVDGAAADTGKITAWKLTIYGH